LTPSIDWIQSIQRQNTACFHIVSQDALLTPHPV